MVVFGLAVAVEGLAKGRHVTVVKAKRSTLARYSIPFLHGLQAATGYTLMLIAMTFSMELMFSVVLGLAVAYAVFFRLPPPANDDDNDISDPYQLRQHVTTNPCCEFMEEESKETIMTGVRARRPPRANNRGTSNNREEDLTLILEGEEEGVTPSIDTTI